MRMPLTACLVKLLAVALNVLYRLFSLGSRENMILFVSRQSDVPSNDFRALGEEFSARGFKPVFLAKRLTKKTVFAYAAHALREIRCLARCRVCFLDRYDPVVSLIDFKCESDQSSGDGVLHREFPCEPVIVQLWHAFGAFKKFGYQTADVAEGHSLEEMKLFKIHRNYSWIVCSGEGARRAFAEAFSYPENRVIPLSRPEQRRLLNEREGVGAGFGAGRISLLFAPTVRKYDKTVHPFRDLCERHETWHEDSQFAVTWAFHPLDEGREVALGAPKTLAEADCVVTDYSSIVYEAYLLGVKVFFYIPDIEYYRRSPGLNADPALLASPLVARSETELAAMLGRLADDPLSYPQEALERFVGDSFKGSADDPASSLVDFLLNGAEGISPLVAGGGGGNFRHDAK